MTFAASTLRGYVVAVGIVEALEKYLEDAGKSFQAVETVSVTLGKDLAVAVQVLEMSAILMHAVDCWTMQTTSAIAWEICVKGTDTKSSLKISQHNAYLVNWKKVLLLWACIIHIET
mmetsp:Transcript_26540/g.34237  ORF Transcript_26540/g.34237 Transcript_26540/m.34237 type:complete len:117 (+) Transcript_26540:2291-2641(+)